MYQSIETKTLLPRSVQCEVKYGKLDRLKSGIGSNSKGCSPLTTKKNPNRFSRPNNKQLSFIVVNKGVATVAWKMVGIATKKVTIMMRHKLKLVCTYKNIPLPEWQLVHSSIIHWNATYVLTLHFYYNSKCNN